MQLTQSTAKEIIRLQPYMHLIQAIAEGKEVLLKNHFGENIKANNLGLPVDEYFIAPERIILKTRQYLFYYNGSKTFKIHTITWSEYCSYNPDFTLEASTGFIRWIDEWIETEVEL